MLRVTTIHANTAGPSARYYTRYLADDGPEGEGQWLGRQAAALGLSGSVSTDDLEALLSGHDPVTGTRLGNPLVDRYDAKGNLIPAVAGFDATFSAPKSLSVWWGLTGDPGLAEAHDLAVRAVLEHLERYGATTRVRVNGNRQHPDAEGLVMAAFRQTTSREDDPQLHTHVVISTKVQTADGRWLALDARYLKRKQRALGGLYQSVLRAELTHRYGVAWEPILNGQAEIAGMPRDLLDAFSKRTAQVDSLLATKVTEFREREGRDPSRWERAALTRQAAEDSRATKTHASTTELQGQWTDEAHALGWTPDGITAAMRDAARDTPSRDTIDLAGVLEQLSANGSTWTRADVIQAVCDIAPPVSQFSGRDWANAVEQAADRVIDACISLDPPTAGAPVRASDGRSIWLAPSEPHLTHERVLAEEERILTFAIEAHDRPAAPSTTLEPGGLDVLQADAAAAVAGHDSLVLIVGPAGTGKTTSLRRAVEDLAAQGRPVFGVAPTAKAAKVLRDETGLPTDTLAKLLYEWRTGLPNNDYRLPAGTTVIVDEAGMLGTGNLDDLTKLAVSQQWRLVLVGDPRQLQAVGRGGMFDELCRIGRTNELASIHRFRQPWEQEASLQLRAGNTDALDAYLDHGRVTAAASFDDLAAGAARRWVEHNGVGRSVAVVAETNVHVDALNHAVQQERRGLGHVSDRPTPIAGTETASVGDIVVTRRNVRTLRTDRDEPVRNRDRWTVTTIGKDGSLTLSHLQGHGHVTIPAEYAQTHVRLGYAGTAHGHQGDTVDIGITVVTAATTHRSLYVGATRGRDENQLLVLADERHLTAARDILEQALTNDRADIPATVQRRHLARQVPRELGAERPLSSAEDRLSEAREAFDQARHRAEPFLHPVREAQTDLYSAEAELRQSRRQLADAPIWRRGRIADSVAQATNLVTEADTRLASAEEAASPYVTELEAARSRLDQAQHKVDNVRFQERLDRLTAERQTHSLDRGLGIDLPGM